MVDALNVIKIPSFAITILYSNNALLASLIYMRCISSKRRIIIVWYLIGLALLDALLSALLGDFRVGANRFLVSL